jgi:hypothetical protein
MATPPSGCPCGRAPDLLGGGWARRIGSGMSLQNESEDGHLQAAGQSLLMSTALLLVARASRDGSEFPTEVGDLEEVVGSIRPELANKVQDIDVVAWGQPIEMDRIRVWISPRHDGSLRISVVYVQGRTIYADVHADGRTSGGGVTSALTKVD